MSLARDVTFRAFLSHDLSGANSIQMTPTELRTSCAEGVEIALMGSLPRRMGYEAGALMTMGSVLFTICLLPAER